MYYHLDVDVEWRLKSSDLCPFAGNVCSQGNFHFGKRNEKFGSYPYEVSISFCGNELNSFEPYEVSVLRGAHHSWFQ